ncbi:hypothetical protein [Acinetobacter bereziniae]|uniref:hypothetical protein n=1 Tax=Acinetobacter bereziniae TaxID=106648 RepID=UPI00148EFF85|nr:hypothetical protein [Acinetobacter bereziniae]
MSEKTLQPHEQRVVEEKEQLKERLNMKFSCNLIEKSNILVKLYNSKNASSINVC